MMKLDANRHRDREDVRVLLARCPSSMRAVRDQLQQDAPALVSRLAEVVVTS
jgi:hypothetical protein